MSRRTTSDRYFETIDGLAGKAATHYTITDSGEAPAVHVAVYEDVPEPGHTTSFTFGLSSVHHQEWIGSKPELLVSVRSKDHAWGLCVGEIVRNYRHDSLFPQGTILHFRRNIAQGSRMTSLLVFACTLLDREEQKIVLSDRTVNLSQVYPIYEEEAHVLRRVGLERFFWDLGIDFYDTGRAPARLGAA